MTLFIAGDTNKPLHTVRCHCGDYPVLVVLSDSEGLVCACGAKVEPRPFHEADKLVDDWNELYRTGGRNAV